MAVYTFTADKYIEADNSITLTLQEIDLVVNGNTVDEAKKKLAEDNIIKKDKDELLNALNQLKSDQDYYLNLANKARNTFISNFSEENLGASVGKVIISKK